MTQRDQRTAAGLFLICFLCYAWFFSGGGWNQNAHFDLARAVVERGTLYIDGYHLNTGDVSVSDASGQRHAYINKPPGASFLAAIPYAPLYYLEKASGIDVDSWAAIQLNAYIVTVFTCGLTGALIPLLLFRYARERVAAPPVIAALAALAIALGTIVFPYSTMLFSHVPAALFLLLAFVWLDKRPLLAGMSAGIAGITYLLCIPVAIVFFVVKLTQSRRDAFRFAAGGIPFGLILGAYQYVCFGSAFRTSLEISTRFTREGLFLGVFGLPDSEALWGLTFSEYRGLFHVSPVLLFVIPGLWWMFRRNLRREAVMIVAAFAILLFANAAFNNWEGGSAFGPRYLIPAIPLLGVPLLFVRGGWTMIAAVMLGVASFAIQIVATAVDPMPAGWIQHPVRDYMLPAFTGHAPKFVGQTSINTQSIDEPLPHAKYPRGSHESAWASFNLGEVLTGPGENTSVLPIAIFVIAGSGALLRYARAGEDTRAPKA
ncbi:MAG TPA: hypothetical protein VF057_07785 [Thermoanaerobaculia bacterium]